MRQKIIQCAKVKLDKEAQDELDFGLQAHYESLGQEKIAQKKTLSEEEFRKEKKMEQDIVKKMLVREQAVCYLSHPTSILNCLFALPQSSFALALNVNRV